MAAPAWLEISKHLHVSARLGNPCLFCMFGRLAGEEENSDKSQIRVWKILMCRTVCQLSVQLELQL